MRTRNPTVWMWSTAFDLIGRADHMQRQCFQLSAQRNACPTWEPPVDIFETDEQVIVLAALPGVCAEQLSVALDGATVSLRGQRSMPGLGATAQVHLVEIPYGRFERRIQMPAPGLRLGTSVLQDGCLLLALDKPIIRARPEGAP